MVQEDLPTLNHAPWWRTPWAVGLAVGAVALAGMFYALRLIDNTTLPKQPLTTLAGKTTDLPTLAAGKPTVVNLWATWCQPCRLELPFLATAQRQELGIKFVFVDQGEDPVTVERYLSTVRLDLFNVLLDTGNKLSSEMGSPGLPITLFYDSSGRMIDSHLGALSPSLLAAKLTQLRPSKR
ncbi:MAG: TlpA disulfide reductase family protein [Pseudomonadota bacterium]